jgi:hypothetical protein
MMRHMQLSGFVLLIVGSMLKSADAACGCNEAKIPDPAARKPLDWDEEGMYCCRFCS